MTISRHLTCSLNLSRFSLFNYQGAEMPRRGISCADHSAKQILMWSAPTATLTHNQLCVSGKLININTVKMFCQHLFLIFISERRRRDLNPRAAINDLHPFQGCPFGQLGYFSEYDKFWKANAFQTERVGFEPTCPCGQTVFKTASLWPLRYLSVFLTYIFRQRHWLY